jgi:predicted enzyme related to lactoylglutathione lyase
MSVTGIGGLFFRAENPDALSTWYRTHFAIGVEPYGQWNQSSGPTVFMPFPSDTDYFAGDKQWMINLRVDGLEALLEKLRESGIEVTTKPEWNTPETGRFARVTDPEGNAVELWEPPPE